MRIVTLSSLASIALCAALMSGCAIGPDYVAPEMDVPTAWADHESATERAVKSTWWTNFGDTTLDALVAEALQHNDDLAVAMANVDASRAQLGVATSYLFPTIGLDGSSYRSRPSDSGATPPLPDDIANSLHSVSAGVSFELDLWGKYRRGQEAMKASLLSTEASYATIRLAVISQTVEGYFALLSVDSQLAIATRTLASRLESEKLRFERYELGITTELDYRQAQAETAATIATVRQLEQALSAAETSLSVLLGRSPRDIVSTSPERGLDLALMKVPADVPAGLPASLMSRRPDIATAAQSLHMATAMIGYTEADLLPSISLTGLFGFESLDLTQLISSNSTMWTYGAGLSMPIFTFGRTLSQIDEAEATQRGAVATYEKTVRNAFAEVKNALVAIQKTSQIVDAYAGQVLALGRTLKLAKDQYESGVSDFLTVLDAERGLLQAQLTLVEAQRARLSAVVSLCKALGGGWSIDDLATPVTRDVSEAPSGTQPISE